MRNRLTNFWKGIAPQVRILGIVSLLTDISSEIIYPLLPYFLTKILGASATAMGTIEGAAESIASILKAFSGILSDRMKKRKPLILAGYTLSTLAKPTVGLALKPWHVFLARILDRTGKGIRTSPRDALISESTQIEKMGKAFGFHRAMDTVGAVMGPLLAAFFLWAFNPFMNEGLKYRSIFLFSLIPGALSVLLLLKGVHEKGKGVKKDRLPFGRLPYPRFWVFLSIMAIFSLGNSSDTFVLLRAHNLGVSANLIPIFYLIFNVVYAFSAAPVGTLSDSLGRGRTLSIGLLVYAGVYFGLSSEVSIKVLLLLFLLYGIYYALVEGVGRAMVADLVPQELRGTAYGYYHMIIGFLLLPASLIAGFLWDKIGPQAPFLFGGALSGVAGISLLIFRK